MRSRPTATLYVRVDPALVDRCNTIRDETGLSMARVIGFILEDWFREHPEPVVLELSVRRSDGA